FPRLPMMNIASWSLIGSAHLFVVAVRSLNRREAPFRHGDQGINTPPSAGRRRPSQSARGAGRRPYRLRSRASAVQGLALALIDRPAGRYGAPRHFSRVSIGSMDIRDGFLDAIGNTPLIHLRKASAATGCRILGKAEFLNPGGSVKDRAALAIVQDAQAKGHL